MPEGSQWERLDLPLLSKVAELEGDEGSRVRDDRQLADALGAAWTEPMVLASVGRLVQADYLAATNTTTMRSDGWMQIGLTERGRRKVGLWPGDDAAATLLRIIDERIGISDDPQDRDRWRRLRDAAASVGQGVLTGVLVETAKRGVLL